MSTLSHLASRLGTADAVLVTVHATRGSVPREVGAWMAVFSCDAVGTVGGGRLELDALALAREHLAAGQVQGEAVVRYPLGPALGQCCGGEVHLRYEWLNASSLATLQGTLESLRTPVALFGGGHVGQALINVLSSLPMNLAWFDSRDEIFPSQLPAHVQAEHSEPVHAAVAGLAPGTQVLIMSFSHAEDLDIVAACLARQRQRGDLPYVGLIGSKTKWASFRPRLMQRGFQEAELAHVTCPIGIPGICDKRPEIIAVAVAAQLLQGLDAQRLPTKH